jgi:hypothetical protein
MKHGESKIGSNICSVLWSTSFTKIGAKQKIYTNILKRQQNYFS